MSCLHVGGAASGLLRRVAVVVVVETRAVGVGESEGRGGGGVAGAGENRRALLKAPPSTRAHAAGCVWDARVSAGAVWTE
jgi:hypothetical protein